jgi:ubiquinone/menaquinone biosynthesis C-methylase UbiE
MKNPGSNRPYKWLAQHYDALFNFHVAWYQSAREHVLAEVLPAVKSACDLACDTGTTALSLASKGIKMYGVDLSPIMCRLAREKAKRLRIPLHVLRADMCKFRYARFRLLRLWRRGTAGRPGSTSTFDPRYNGSVTNASRFWWRKGE